MKKELSNYSPYRVIQNAETLTTEGKRRALTPQLSPMRHTSYIEKPNEINKRLQPITQNQSYKTSSRVSEHDLVTNVNQSFGYGGVSDSFLEKISNQELYDKNIDPNFQKYINELTNQVVHARSLKMKLASMPFRGSTSVPFTKSSNHSFYSYIS